MNPNLGGGAEGMSSAPPPAVPTPGPHPDAGKVLSQASNTENGTSQNEQNSPVLREKNPETARVINPIKNEEITKDIADSNPPITDLGQLNTVIDEHAPLTPDTHVDEPQLVVSVPEGSAQQKPQSKEAGLQTSPAAPNVPSTPVNQEITAGVPAAVSPDQALGHPLLNSPADIAYDKAIAYQQDLAGRSHTPEEWAEAAARRDAAFNDLMAYYDSLQGVGVGGTPAFQEFKRQQQLRDNLPNDASPDVRKKAQEDYDRAREQVLAERGVAPPQREAPAVSSTSGDGPKKEVGGNGKPGNPAPGDSEQNQNKSAMTPPLAEQPVNPGNQLKNETANGMIKDNAELQALGIDVSENADVVAQIQKLQQKAKDHADDQQKPALTATEQKALFRLEEVQKVAEGDQAEKAIEGMLDDKGNVKPEKQNEYQAEVKKVEDGQEARVNMLARDIARQDADLAKWLAEARIDTNGNINDLVEHYEAKYRNYQQGKEQMSTQEVRIMKRLQEAKGRAEFAEGNRELDAFKASGRSEKEGEGKRAYDKAWEKVNEGENWQHRKEQRERLQTRIQSGDKVLINALTDKENGFDPNDPDINADDLQAELRHREAQNRGASPKQQELYNLLDEIKGQAAGAVAREMAGHAATQEDALRAAKAMGHGHSLERSGWKKALDGFGAWASGLGPEKMGELQREVKGLRASLKEQRELAKHAKKEDLPRILENIKNLRGLAGALRKEIIGKNIIRAAILIFLILPLVTAFATAWGTAKTMQLAGKTGNGA